MPAFLATASSPFFSMVFKAFVDKRSLTKRLPASHQTFLYCRLTNCNFLVLWLEKETLLALFAFFPVKGQILPDTKKKKTVSKAKKGPNVSESERFNREILSQSLLQDEKPELKTHTCRNRDIT